MMTSNKKTLNSMDGYNKGDDGIKVWFFKGKYVGLDKKGEENYKNLKYKKSH